MNYLWRFHWDCGRNGDVEGLFIASEEEVRQSFGKRVVFGEILGKHSYVHGTLEKEEFAKIDVSSLSQEVLEDLVSILGGTTLSGYNPLNYIEED